MAGIFERLCGLETEYAIRYQPTDSASPAPSKFRLYESLVGALGRQLPTAKAKHFKEGVFLANGGAVWFEAERPAAGGGLIEGATPECRGPRQLLAHQLAQDRLLAQASEKARIRGSLQLIKNDQDATGNLYGAQENYEADLADGWRLWVWRAGLVLLFPLAVVTWVLVFGCVLSTLAYFLLAALIYLPCRLLTGGHERLSMLLFGRDLTEGRESCVHLPVWLESVLQAVTRFATAPLALALYGLLRVTAFHGLRRVLLPFLVSRTVLTGSGLLDAQGRFQLADKAPGINCVLGFGGIVGDRPIFTMGHFFKAVYAESWFSPREYQALFAQRQRLQIAIGDSNMCETSQFLRIGTTLLVLDAVDAGFFGDVPRLRSPIRALHDICSDPSLRCAAPLDGEKEATALEIQAFFFAGCRAFVGSQPEAPQEAWEVLDLWKQQLEALQRVAAGEPPPERLIGVLDWVTKKYLLDEAAGDAPWEQRKKVDIRYHELSTEGYFELLRAGGVPAAVVSEAEVERAMRTPPPDSPATMRGHYIREFGGGEERFTVNWKSVVMGQGWNKRRIPLGQYHPGRSLARRPRPGARDRQGPPRG